MNRQRLMIIWRSWQPSNPFDSGVLHPIHDTCRSGLGRSYLRSMLAERTVINPHHRLS